MLNKPEFSKAFQALAQIRSLFIDEFYYKIFAYMAYYYLFKNKGQVMNTIFSGFDKTKAEAIY